MYRSPTPWKDILFALTLGFVYILLLVGAVTALLLVSGAC